MILSQLDTSSSTGTDQNWPSVSQPVLSINIIINIIITIIDIIIIITLLGCDQQVFIARILGVGVCTHHQTLGVPGSKVAVSIE